MLTLYLKGQIQRELDGEVKNAQLLALQYLHLLVPAMNALCAPCMFFTVHVLKAGFKAHEAGIFLENVQFGLKVFTILFVFKINSTC